MSTTRYANDITAGVTWVEAHDCADCGVVFGLDRRFAERRREDGRGFYCPNGHVLSWERSIDEARLQRQIDGLQAQLTHAHDQRDAAEHSARAYKGHVTRIRRRVGRGVCPCCNRMFADLARHMDNKHPEYADGDA